MVAPVNPNQVDVNDAGSQFPRLLGQVEAGVEVIIARDGKPVAKLSAMDAHVSHARKAGWAKGRVVIHDDFAAAMPEATDYSQS